MKLPLYKYIILFLDVLVACIAMLSVYSLGGGIESREIMVLFASLAILVVILQYYHLYKANVFLDRFAHLSALTKAFVYFLLLAVFINFVADTHLLTSSRQSFFFFVVINTLLFFVYRILLLPVFFRRLAASGVYHHNILVVGARENALNFTMQLLKKCDWGFDVAGFVDDTVPVGTPLYANHCLLGRTEDIPRLVKETGADEIMITDASLEKMLSLIPLAKQSGVHVRALSAAFSVITDKVPTEHYSLHPTVSLTEGFYSPITAIYQRLADLVLAALAIIVLSPFLLLIALLVRLSSPGPVFFRQERVGKDGKLFGMLKFRSMHVASGEDRKRKEMMIDFIRNGTRLENGDNKVVNAARITPIGAFIRKYSIDELPQLINVLKGEMSLVGPRPTLPYEYEAYKPWHHGRHRVMPGCTGFWQVYGRGSASFDEMVIMDLYMIENMSPWFYLQIIVKTVPVLLFARGGK